MPEPPELILLALSSFSVGDIGWVTERGVIRPPEGRAAPMGTMRVKTLEGIRPLEHGRFREVGSSDR